MNAASGGAGGHARTRRRSRPTLGMVGLRPHVGMVGSARTSAWSGASTVVIGRILSPDGTLRDDGQSVTAASADNSRTHRTSAAETPTTLLILISMTSSDGLGFTPAERASNAGRICGTHATKFRGAISSARPGMGRASVVFRLVDDESRTVTSG